ncbi:MAG: LptF/LptG family permease, partial [Rhodothermales bacterium]
MTTFDWHIIRRLATGYVYLLVALIIFFILLHYLEYIDDFLDREAPMKEIYTIYYPSYIPEIVRLISPLALFLSCVYLTGKLAQTMQLVALQTSGVSLYRLLRPYLLVAVLVTGLMIWFNGWIVPVTNRTVLEYDGKYLKSAPRQVDTNDIHRQNRPG